MIKKIFILFLLTLPTQIIAKETLVIGTYDSFSSEWGPGPEIELLFEKNCNCDVQFIATNQAGSLNSDIFKKGKDLLLGIEVNDFNEEDSAYWSIYDYGYFAFIYNKNKIKNPPTSFDELISNNKLKIVVQDPRTSPLGLGLLRWMNKIYSDNFIEKFKLLDNQIITYTPGWSEAYGMFLDDKADLVLSYSTSPFYHQEYENDFSYQAMIFNEGHMITEELVVVRKKAKNFDLAKKFVDFMKTEDVQKIISAKNIMYPINDKSTPERMKKLDKPNTLNAVSISSEKLISDWLKATID
jgi:thiamine transport system substrate-binding protein